MPVILLLALRNFLLPPEHLPMDYSSPHFERLSLMRMERRTSFPFPSHVQKGVVQADRDGSLGGAILSRSDGKQSKADFPISPSPPNGVVLIKMETFLSFFLVRHQSR